MVKRELPSVRYVAVWMTMAGYWNSIAPGSPLEKKYGMKRYAINRANVPGQDWPESGFDNQQTGTATAVEDRFYLLPSPERAAEFWRDYFGACRPRRRLRRRSTTKRTAASSMASTAARSSSPCGKPCLAAANETFGRNRVIHCMAHYERTFSGDIGLGIPTSNEKIIVRNSG